MISGIGKELNFHFAQWAESAHGGLARALNEACQGPGRTAALAWLAQPVAWSGWAQRPLTGPARYRVRAWPSTAQTCAGAWERTCGGVLAWLATSLHLPIGEHDLTGRFMEEGCTHRATWPGPLRSRTKR
jgi:hypothetical protein